MWPLNWNEFDTPALEDTLCGRKSQMFLHDPDVPVCAQNIGPNPVSVIRGRVRVTIWEHRPCSPSQTHTFSIPSAPPVCAQTSAEEAAFRRACNKNDKQNSGRKEATSKHISQEMSAPFTHRRFTQRIFKIVTFVEKKTSTWNYVAFSFLFAEITAFLSLGEHTGLSEHRWWVCLMCVPFSNNNDWGQYHVQNDWLQN